MRWSISCLGGAYTSAHGPAPLELKRPPFFGPAVTAASRPRDTSVTAVDAIRAHNADGKPARMWPIQFLIRRTAHHVMDHAWEFGVTH
jgi:hypothetical protein